MEYKDYNDNELICYIGENNEDAMEIIYKKYEPIINNIANKIIKCYGTIGIEKNDLVQEGMIGLSNAIDSYKENKTPVFYSFAKMCIQRQMISAIRLSSTQKNKALNESFSFENNEEEITFQKVLKDDTKNPEKMYFSMENENKIIDIAKSKLTDFELQVFELRINNFDYNEIAQILDKDTKSVDNALTRIKSKLKKELEVA